ncbi:amidohydrolase family protein [Pseudonocardia sp. GCM10023141]|uniref:amidohydrolase family protein n=1 Tax=Pseudonocardia sp. GCM10023141 TaxID=3252653 RepID=UPI003623D74B
MTSAPDRGRRTTKITDAQAHVWQRVVPGATPHYEAPFTAEALVSRMDEAGVQRAIIVPPSWADDGNEVALAAADAHPDRLAVMGVAALDAPDAKQRLSRWRDRPGLLGLRQPFHVQPYIGWLDTRSLDWVWTVAAAAGMPVMVYPAGLVAKFERIAREFPDLRLVVDHMGLPLDTSPVRRLEAVHELVRLSRYPNVAVKLSALPLYSHEAFPFRDVHDSVCRVLEAFGPHRSFWGSDLTRLSCSYGDAVAMMGLIDGLSESERELVMGEAVSAWLGWLGHR